MSKKDGIQSPVMYQSGFANNSVLQEKNTTSIYDLEYYSGAQAFMYIGDVWVDEVTSISYSIQQNKQPIYGYASQTFDDVAHGTVLVQGNFTVNFKESGYLWLVLLRYQAFQQNVDNVLRRYGKFRTNGNAPPSTLDIADKFGPNGAIRSQYGGGNVPFARLFSKEGRDVDFITRATIERLVSGEASRTERFEFYQDLAGFATVDNPNRKDKVFEDIVEAFEDQVWLDKDSIGDIDKLARRVDDNFFDDFDMYVVYGDFTKGGANHTVRRIRNVHLLGMGQSIEYNGEVIQESYNFLARSII